MKLETFTAEPPCAGCTHLLELADEIKKKYKGKVNVEKHVGPCKEFDKYDACNPKNENQDLSKADIIIHDFSRLDIQELLSF